MDQLLDQAIKILPAGQALMILGIIVVIKLLWGISEKMSGVLTAITQLETWRELHEHANEKAFATNEREHLELWRRLNKTERNED